MEIETTVVDGVATVLGNAGDVVVVVTSVRAALWSVQAGLFTCADDGGLRR
jgi:hypothetical protein